VLHQIKKIDILAVGVHPDDVELSCSGTLFRHLQLGKRIGLLDLTEGELGTRGTSEIRKKEPFDAAFILNAQFRVNLDMGDGFFEYNQFNIEQIIRVIRACEPTIVLCNALEDRHPDHGKAARLVSDACFYSGLVKIQTKDDVGNIQSRWRPDQIFHYIQDRNLTPDFVVDITGFMDQKLYAIGAYKSQFNHESTPEYASELTSPISGKDFMDYIVAKARSYGRVAGFEFGEWFNNSRTPGIKNLFDLY
jgi:N-acetylglucosamine malate deacetylase 1